jgi:hypothetical protein
MASRGFGFKYQNKTQSHSCTDVVEFVYYQTMEKCYTLDPILPGLVLKLYFYAKYFRLFS